MRVTGGSAGWASCRAIAPQVKAIMKQPNQTDVADDTGHRNSSSLGMESPRCSVLVRVFSKGPDECSRRIGEQFVEGARLRDPASLEHGEAVR